MFIYREPSPYMRSETYIVISDAVMLNDGAGAIVDLYCLNGRKTMKMFAGILEILVDQGIYELISSG